MRSTATPVSRALAYALDGETGVVLNLSMRGKSALHVDLISVTQKSNGVGSRVMNNLVRFADINDMWIELSPSSVFGSDPDRLAAWYGSFGFKKNGAKKMIRNPKAI